MCCCMPVGFTFVWLSVFGNTALFLELNGSGAGISEAVLNDMPTALFVLLERLPGLVCFVSCDHFDRYIFCYLVRFRFIGN